MTITSSIQNTVSALGDGVTTDYTIGFDFQHNDQLKVYLYSAVDDSITQILEGEAPTKYTVTGMDPLVADSPGTTVVMGTAPTASQRVIIKRILPLYQEVDYGTGSSSFPALDHEEQMDAIVMQIQQINEVVQRSIQYPEYPIPTANQLNAQLYIDTINNAVSSVAIASGAASDSQDAAALSEQAALDAQAAADASALSALAAQNASNDMVIAAAASAGEAAASAQTASDAVIAIAAYDSSAADSALAASTSETNAGLSAAAALTSEGNAATSESNAATSETNAAASALAADASADAAALSEAAVTGVIDTDNTLAADLDTKVASQKAIKSYVTTGLGTKQDTITANSIDNTELAQMPAHTFKGNDTAGLANAKDLTQAELTAELAAFVGDTGTGGTKGLVPAPAIGDAAAGKVLKADGSWGAAGTASPLTTKGDLYGFSTANDRLPISTNGKVLTADSTASLGVSWQTINASFTTQNFTGTSITTTADGFQRHRHTGATPQTLAAITTTLLPDAGTLEIFGTSDTNTLYIADGNFLKQRGPIELGAGASIVVRKDSTLGGLYEVSRNT